jgi:cellulose synthase/poly-beta-1,6-N-acetylglucosamine synthase-like glycosyltransferase
MILGAILAAATIISTVNLVTALANLKEAKKYDTYTPKVSFISKCWNDGLVVERRIKNALAFDYPKNKYEVIIADNGSTDNTQRICKRYQKQGKIKYHREPEHLSLAAKVIDHAIEKHATGDIIVETDIDALCPPSWLGEMVKPYQDPKIQGVTGTVMCGNYNQSWLSRLRAIEDFWFFCTSMAGRYKLTGQGMLYGGCKSYTKKIWKKLGGHKNLLCEDASLAAEIIGNGHKIAIQDKIPIVQEEVYNLKQYFDERKRWVYGNLEVSEKYSKQLMKDKFNFIILTANFAWDLAILSSLVLLPISSLFLIPLGLSFSTLFFSLKKYKAKSSLYIWSIPYLILSPALQALATMAAIKDKLIKGKVDWAKVWHYPIQLDFPTKEQFELPK